MKKDKNGYYNTKVKIGVDANGKAVNKWIRSKTLKGIEQEKARIRAEYIDGHAAAGDVLFGTYAAKWLEVHIKEKKLAPNTISGYRYVLRNFILPYLGEKNMKAVSTSDIMLAIGNANKSSKLRVRNICSMIFRLAISDRIVEYNPALNIIAEKGKSNDYDINPMNRRGLRKEERNALVETFNEYDEVSLFMIIAYYFGLRISEITGLKWGDFDWENNLLHITRQYVDLSASITEPKTRAAIRYVPIPVKARFYLYHIRKNDDDFVLTYRGIENVTKYYADHARQVFRELFPYEKMTMHWLRHNYVCMCWENNVDPYATAKIVGHSDVTVTLRIYNHLSEDRKKEGHSIIVHMFD